MPFLPPALVASLSLAPAPKYAVQVQMVRGADTMATTIHLPAGVEAHVVSSHKGGFTRLKLRIADTPTAGCPKIFLATVTRETEEAVEEAKVEPVPVIQICDGPTAVVVVDEVRYRVTVREIEE
jgi:hypothetical protein